MQSTPNASGTPVLNSAFLGRVYLGSVVFSVLGAGIAASRISGNWALGYFSLAIWSTANLWALDYTLRLVAAEHRNGAKIALAIALKLIVIYGAGFFLIFKGGFPPVSILVGFSVPLAVVLLKALGGLLAARLNATPAAAKTQSR